MKYWLWIIPIDYEPARDLWDFCLREGVAAMQYEIGQKNAELNRDLARQIAVGDKVVAYLNQRRVGGVGTVTKPFFEDPTGYESDYGNAYGQRVGVKWLAAIGGPIDVRGLPIAMKSLESLVLQGKTIHPIDQAAFEQIAEAVQITHQNPVQIELASLIESARMKSAIQLYRSRPEANAKDRLIKQHAYEQIRRLIAPEVLSNLTIDDFDGHILQIGRVIYEGQKYKSWKFQKNYSIDELKTMLENGTVRVVGNCTWGFGATTIRAFFAKSGLEDEAIAEQLHDALRVLQDDAKPIKERLEKAQSVNGLWPNLTTGTLMALAPDEWIVWNDKSNRALKLFGLTSELKYTVDNYLIYNEFTKRIRDRYGLKDLVEVDAVFNRYVDKNGLLPNPLVGLSAYVIAHGFHFPTSLLATYFLSLQTKPFAILTGVSGTGKTKLAQLFAEWMSPTIEVQTVVKETPVDDSESFYLEVRPSYLGSGFVIPKRAYVYFDVPDLSQTITISVQLGETGEAVECSLRNQPSGGSSYVYFFSKKRVREWLGENFEPGDILQFQVVDEGTEYKLNKFTPTISRRMVKRTPRLAFISVRPDWTDNRGLLGFYNLITHAYQTTDFLHLLVQATLELDMPHFVILDEMNLAKVEYYFADFLSVLESRYIQEGELKQSPLRLHDLPRCVLAQGELFWGEEAELEEAEQFMCHVRCDGCPLRQGVDERQWSRGESGYDEACKAGFDPERYVPPRLFVPHNVYFSGTVNVDETTYMFSPKVLDRANTIEFDEVDLEDYFVRETVVSDAVAADDTIRAAFTFNGEFTLLPKAVPIRTDEDLTPYRGRLIALNNLLQPYNMHFGYRVADEVLLYLWNVRKLNDPAFDLEVAFDHQLCQKVLPKFHGSQAKLQDPLERLLLFCSDPRWQSPIAGPELDATDRQRIRELKGKSVDDLRSAGVRYPRAARKIRRMLDALEKEGFASFA